MAQTKLTKFHHAHDRYWEAVRKSLMEQYHRDEETAVDGTHGTGGKRPANAAGVG